MTLNQNKMKAKLSKEGGGYDLYRIDEDGKRVTFASTQDFKQKLSLKNCEAIERGYDFDELEELAQKEIHNLKPINPHPTSFFAGYRRGFQKALEILGDKKFSEEDIINAHSVGRNYQRNAEKDCHITPYLNSLQQTEWDCIIEMEYNLINHASGLELTGHELMDVAISQNYKPKLDADGCLILKRK